MIAVIGTDNAGIADLTVLVEAPFLKLSNHLTLANVLIEAAGGAGAGILGVLGSESSESVLSHFGFAPQSLDLVDGFLAGIPVVLSGFAVFTGGADLNQNVTDIYGIIVVFVSFHEHDNVITGGSDKYVGLAGQTLLREEPVGVVGAGVGIGVFTEGVRLILIGFLAVLGSVGKGGLDEAVLSGVQFSSHGIGSFLCGIGVIIFGGDAEYAVAYHIIALAVFIVVGTKVIIGVFKALALGGGISSCDLLYLQIVFVAFQISALTVGSLQIVVHFVKAVALCVSSQSLAGAVNGGLGFLVQSEALFHGSVIQSVDLQGSVSGSIGDEIGPGAAIFAEQAILIGNGLGGVNYIVPHTVGVVDGILIIISILIVVVEIHRGQLMGSNGQCGCMGLHVSAVEENQQGKGKHDDDGHGRADGTADLFGLCGRHIAFVLLFLLLLNDIGIYFRFAEFAAQTLFSGCAHMGSVLSCTKLSKVIIA